MARPSAPLPRRYRVSRRVGHAEFGDGLAGGRNGHDGGETAEPWSTEDATEQNGFSWLAITDAPARPHDDDAGFVVEPSGEFRHGGRRTYRAASPFDAHGVFHYNPPGVRPRGACVDESPAPEADSPAPRWPRAGGWPDWFFFGDPHANDYEGTAYYDDLRLEVFREGG